MPSVVIRPYENTDAETLYQISHNPETVHLWAPQMEVLSFEKFKEKLERRINHRWSDYHSIVSSYTSQVIGFAYCYNTSASDTTSVCIYIDKPFMATMTSIQASYLYIEFLFKISKYRKIYAEVFAYNEHCLRLLKKLNFDCEGCLKEHQWWNDQYWSMYIYSLNLTQFGTESLKHKKIITRFN